MAESGFERKPGRCLEIYSRLKESDGLIDRVIADVEQTIICNNKGNKAILIYIDELSSWQETLYLLSNSVNAKHILGSIQSAKASEIIERDLIED